MATSMTSPKSKSTTTELPSTTSKSKPTTASESTTTQAIGANITPAPQNQPVDPRLVAILNRLVNTQEKQANDKNEFKRFTQFPTVKFDGSEPAKSLDHWNIFMQYLIFVLRKGYVPNHTDPTYYAIFCQQYCVHLVQTDPGQF